MACKYLLIDGNNLICRAHFASNLTDRKGRPVSGTLGVMRMTRSLIRKFQPRVVVITWDGGKSKQRTEVYPEYKANRLNRDEEMQKHILRQAKACIKIFSTLPVRQIKVKGVEGDDIIGLLCEKLKGKKVVISNDTDFVQLVSKNTHLYLPNKKQTKDDRKEGFMLTPKNVESYLGFPVKHYILWKSLVGDNSDNIKGIKGIGAKKATNIILNGLKGGKKPPINNDEMEILERNKYLIRIAALLQPDEIKKIKKQFVSERDKTVSYKPVRHEFTKLGFKQLTYNFEDWSRAFRRLSK